MTIRLTADQKIKVLNAEDVFIIMHDILMREKKIDRNKEHFWLVCLANNNQILMIELISLGSVKSTVVEPMDVFSFALQKRAVKLIMVHNHPSGELKPSRSDIQVTERMMAIGDFLELPVIEHMIISEKGFYSFATTGLLKKIKQDSTIDLTFKKQEAQAKKLAEQKKRFLKRIEQEKRNEKLKIAKNMLKKGISITTVIATTGLTVDEAATLIPKKKK